MRHVGSATDADKLTIQSLQNIANGLRGATQINVQGEQARFGAQVQQQGQQRSQDFAQAQAQASQSFAQSQQESVIEARQNAALAAQTANSASQKQAQKNRLILQNDEQEFRAEQNALKGPSVSQQRIDAQSAAADQANNTVDAIETSKESGFITVSPDGQSATHNVEEIENPENQNKEIKGTVIGLEKQNTPSKFDSWADTNNRSRQSHKDALRRAGKDTAVMDVLMVKKGEDRKKFVKRMTAYRDRVIKQAFNDAMSKEDFTKEVQFVTRAGVVFKPASAASQREQESRVRGRITKEIDELFGPMPQINLEDSE